MSFSDQSEFDIRCEWGRHGIDQLAPISDVTIIVDVLSFSSCVDIAVGCGARVYPFGFKDHRLAEFAARHQAVAASPIRSEEQISLSPVSLTRVVPGTHLVLPSPNGSELSLAVGKVPVIAACIRNAEAVSHFVSSRYKTVAVIPAGERWPDNTLRVALEDLIGAGAIISRLFGSRSSEAEAAVAAYDHASRCGLLQTINYSSSGRELRERDFPGDVRLAAESNVSASVPMLRDGAYQDARFDA